VRDKTRVVQGEEEIGSPGLKSVMESNIQMFPDPRLIVISNSQWIGDEIPCLTYGMRGMLCATVRVDGGDRNLHSGNDGGVFNEPMSDLVRLMATLLDSQHHILVPGFYEDVDEQLLAPALAGIKVILTVVALVSILQWLM
jgi:acetylornithine deacetylase/succinyl-diaminopimelate desuccinylase-like protein